MNWATKPISKVLKLKQGRYLKPDEMDTEASESRSIPVYGANGVIGYTDRVMFEQRVPLISCRGANCGVTHYTSGPSWISNNSIACFATDAELRFYYYVFKGSSFSDVIGGSAQPQITLSSLSPKRIPVPPVEDQRDIAHILGTYDDLIEVNSRRIRLLERMARAIFEEWFVRFRFPGHESIAIRDTLDGSLPEGWAVERTGEVFECVGGGTPSKAEPRYWEGGTIDWFTPSDLTGAGSVFMERSSTQITSKGLGKSSARLFPPYSVMMTSRATIGAIAINGSEATTNQGFITCIPNERIPFTYLYFWLHQHVPVFIAHATGATFKEISKGVFRGLPLVVPPPDLVSRFDEATRPIFSMILAIEKSVRLLRTSRDLLLPRLISGELSLAAAERQVEEDSAAAELVAAE